MMRANVVMTSKYITAFNPTLPIFLTFSIPENPDTIVQNIIGAIIILMSLINPSPRGLRATANEGKKYPRKIPITIEQLPADICFLGRASCLLRICFNRRMI